MILPAYVQNIIFRLEQNGYEAYAVGGAVRDFLLGRTPDDWDIATSAQPKDVIQIFGEKNCIPTGIKHGTITLIENSRHAEVTTYRIDGQYKDFRHPEEVLFSKNISEDLSRRDFTVNAIAYNPEAGMVDPFNGQNDLKSKILRTVGNPCKRFQEDALRIIRGLRFAAVLDFKIHPDTKSAIHQYKTLLSGIAKERIQSELSRLVTAQNPKDILIEFYDVFFEILGIDDPACILKWQENSAKLCSCPPTLSLRLAILLDDISKDIPPHQLLKSLKYDNKTISLVKAIASNLYTDTTPQPVFIKHQLSNLGEETFRLVLCAKAAKFSQDLCDINKTEEILNTIIDQGQCFCQKDLAVDGSDLLELGFSGKEIGRILKTLLNEVIEDRCENKKSALITLAKNLKEQSSSVN